MESAKPRRGCERLWDRRVVRNAARSRKTNAGTGWRGHRAGTHGFFARPVFATPTREDTMRIPVRKVAFPTAKVAFPTPG